MQENVTLMAAPTAYQPGGYVPKAYADAVTPTTPSAVVTSDSIANGFLISIAWQCPNPVKNISDEVDTFIDAAAILVPTTEYSQIMTMGDTTNPVEGALWRADKDTITLVNAEGLGSMQRLPAPPQWGVTANWQQDMWVVTFELTGWKSLNHFKKIAIAIWLGERAERGGLKSITPTWVNLA
ncbi:hypothetical protein R50073_18230 [Maricurvus nonylphenolicus]|uniref:hypothetical protein n=1 Tax=Maricurvus nonylphenolicus TaxID=1008307 RepID=UPI0036F250EA